MEEVDQEAPEEIIEPEITEEVPEIEDIEGVETEEVETEEVEATGEVDYTPDYSFKVKEEVKEFDDWARDSIKDKETEERVRELYTKANGLDEVKSVRDQVKEELEQLAAAKESQDSTLAELGKFVGKGDYDTFFKTLNIPKEDIIKFAIDELKYQELPPEQKQYIDHQRSTQQRLEQLEQQNRMLEENSQQAASQQAEMQLNTELSRPEVMQQAAEFDARTGIEGGFRQEVIKRGALHEYNGTVVTASQAVSEVLQLIGGTVPQSQTDVTPQATPSPVVASQKPVIPNIGSSSGASPVSKRPASVDDLRQLREKLIAQQG